eukprot:COSAG02_NODE_385_length_23394_cov_43.838807_15_plen_1182_part_00
MGMRMCITMGAVVVGCVPWEVGAQRGGSEGGECDAEQMALYSECWAGGYCSERCGSGADMARRLGDCTVGGALAVEALRRCCDAEQQALVAQGASCFACDTACPVPETLSALGGCRHLGSTLADTLRRSCDDVADCDAPSAHATNQSRTCWGAIGAEREPPCHYQCEAGYGIVDVTAELTASFERHHTLTLRDGRSWLGLTEAVTCPAGSTEWQHKGAPQRACEPCPSGLYSDGHSVGCARCPVGHEPLNATGLASTSCRPCVERKPPGASVWELSQLPCGDGELPDTCRRGVSDGTHCEPCGANEQPSANGSSCEACQRETEHSTGYLCEACPPGYRPDPTRAACVDIHECENPDSHCSPGTICRDLEGSYECSACPETATGTPYISSNPNDPHFCDRADGHVCGCMDIDECAPGYKLGLPGSDTRGPGYLPRWPGRKDGQTACPDNSVCTNLGVSGGLVVSWLSTALGRGRRWIAGQSGHDPASLGYNCSCIENSTAVLLGDTEYHFRRGFDSEKWMNEGYQTCDDIDECTTELRPTGYVVDRTQGTNGLLVKQSGAAENLQPLPPGQDFCTRLQREGYYCPNGGIPYLQTPVGQPIRLDTVYGDRASHTIDTGGKRIPWTHEEHGKFGLQPSGCLAALPFDQRNGTNGASEADIFDLSGDAISSLAEDVAGGGGHIINEIATQMDAATHANQNLLLSAGVCINLPGTHACCMDYKKLIHNPSLIRGRKPISAWADQANPFAPDTYVYPRECQRLDFCTGELQPDPAQPHSGATNRTRTGKQREDWNKYIVSTGVGQPDTGGCDPETTCSATPPATRGYASRRADGVVVAAGAGRLNMNWDSMEAWYGVKCSPCPATGKDGAELQVRWGAQISQDVEGALGPAQITPRKGCEVGTRECPHEPLWNQFCSDQTDAQENAATVSTAVIVFFLVCCCGLIKTNRSMQVELEEARRNELQKLVLENFENHPRRAGYVGNTGLEDEAMPTLELDAETLTNPMALGDYGWKMARFQVGNIGRLGRDGLAVLTTAVGTVVDVTTDALDQAVEFVPGQQYARELVNDGINVVTDATGRVIDSTVEFVPGAAAAGQILSETLDVIPGRELLPDALGGRRRGPLGQPTATQRGDEILAELGQSITSIGTGSSLSGSGSSVEGTQHAHRDSGEGVASGGARNGADNHHVL